MFHQTYTPSEQDEAVSRENGSQGFSQGRNALPQQKGKRKEDNAKVWPETLLRNIYARLGLCVGCLRVQLCSQQHVAMAMLLLSPHIDLCHAGRPGCRRPQKGKTCIWRHNQCSSSGDSQVLGCVGGRGEWPVSVLLLLYHAIDSAVRAARELSALDVCFALVLHYRTASDAAQFTPQCFTMGFLGLLFFCIIRADVHQPPGRSYAFRTVCTYIAPRLVQAAIRL